MIWVRRFHAYCGAHGLPVAEQLTRESVERFADRYCGPRMSAPAPDRVRRPARNALFAWWYALGKGGHALPDWDHGRPAEAALPPLIRDYVDYRKRSRGIADCSMHRDAVAAVQFVRFLRLRGRPVRRVGIGDVDLFVSQRGRRLRVRTVVGICSSLRAFLQFLYAVGKTNKDLSGLVASPRVRRFDRPPRALPWADVRRIVRSARRDGAAAQRDYTVLLLMATYGLGAAEVVSLRTDDFEWEARLLHVRRPKTGRTIELPLLPAVGRAVASYLRNCRPPGLDTRVLFVSHQFPHRALSTSVVRHLVRSRGVRAGLSGENLGGHVFRHSHATRQVDSGANMKVVGDILGHRRSETTSIYVRVALRHLRDVALPVPR